MAHVYKLIARMLYMESRNGLPQRLFYVSEDAEAGYTGFVMRSIVRMEYERTDGPGRCMGDFGEYYTRNPGDSGRVEFSHASDSDVAGFLENWADPHDSLAIFADYVRTRTGLSLDEKKAFDRCVRSVST